MKNTRYYLSIFVILMTSIILLSTSYSKESGNIQSNSSTKEEINNLIVTYSNTNVMETNSDNYISIINNNDHYVTYQIILNRITDSKEDISYQIDNEDVKLLSNTNIIYEKEIGPRGSNNDQITHRINLISNENNKYLVKVNKITYLSNIIPYDKDVYKVDNNYYYYGENPNNYLKINDELYQILGIEKNYVKVLSISKELDTYKNKNNYLTIEDLLKSYNNEEVNINNLNEYKTFLTNESYWLKDSFGYDKYYYFSKSNELKSSYKNILHFQREVKFINSKLEIIKGNGTIEEPYEVYYESY